MTAYSYLTVEDDIPSSSSSKTYAVKIRMDMRLSDPQDRIRQAVLTCNCPGWTKRGEPRSCRHTKEHAADLALFIRENLQRAAHGGKLWLPNSATQTVAETQERLDNLLNTISRPDELIEDACTIWAVEGEPRFLEIMLRLRQALTQTQESIETLLAIQS